MSQFMTNMQNAALGSLFAECITLPICTIKTNYQNTSSNSITDTTKKIYNSLGYKGFYRASLPALLSQTCGSSMKYSLYRYFENKQLPYTNKIINSVLSGLMVSILIHPLDVIKVRYQMGDTLHIKNLYKGYSKNMAKIIVGSSLYMPIYDWSNYYFDNSFKASLFSAVVSTTLLHPIDYLKTRQMYGLTLYNKANKYNPRIYYKGLLINLIRIIPHFVITMTVIENLSKL